MPVAKLLQKRWHLGCWCSLVEQRSLAQEPQKQCWKYTPGLPQMWSHLVQKSLLSLFGMQARSPQSGAVPGMQIWGDHSRKHQLQDHNTTRQSIVDGCPAPVKWEKSYLFILWYLVIASSEISNSLWWSFINHHRNAWFVLLQLLKYMYK